MENLNAADCIRTVSGQYVNVFNPDPDTILIEDIAHALSNMPRFGGHLPYFYSVAQHSVWCAQRIVPELKLDALLHDASEAYLMDMPRPIKNRLTDYKEVENNLMRVIAEKFKIEYPINPVVKTMDEHALRWEWNSIMISKFNYSFRKSFTKLEFLSEFKKYKR